MLVLVNQENSSNGTATGLGLVVSWHLVNKEASIFLVLYSQIRPPKYYDKVLSLMYHLESILTLALNKRCSDISAPPT